MSMINVEEIKCGVPEWVEILLREKFFTPCSSPLHHHVQYSSSSSCCSKKRQNDEMKSFFCLCCHSAICFSCFSSHHDRTHPLLQIRRYVYHEVIRLEDAEKYLLNCSLIQPYTTNSAKVVFLKQRKIAINKMRSGRSGNLCITCFRTLQYPYLFCSLSCKVNAKIEINKIQNKNYDHDLLPPRTKLSEIQSLISDQKISSSVLDLDFPSASPAAINLFKKKSSCVKSLAAVLCRPRCFPVSGIATAVNRRKGVPQRSPLS